MQHLQNSIHQGHATPRNEEARSTPHAAGSKDNETQRIDFKQLTGISQHAAAKAVFTQIAELALHGHAVHQLQDGAYLVCKYGLTKYCEDFAELQDFARKLGVTL